jgi:hypothetical protein
MPNGLQHTRAVYIVSHICGASCLPSVTNTLVPYTSVLMYTLPRDHGASPTHSCHIQRFSCCNWNDQPRWGPNGGNEGGESRVKMSQEIMRRGNTEKARVNNCLSAEVVPPSATMDFEATEGSEPTSFSAAIDAVAAYGFLQYCILNAPGTTLPKEGCYVVLMFWAIWIVNICDMRFGLFRV